MNCWYLFLTIERPGTGIALPQALGGEETQTATVSTALILYGWEVLVGTVILGATVRVLGAL